MAGDVPVWPDNIALMTVKGGCLQELGIIIEVKYAEESQFEVVCREAIAQIDKNRYAEELREEGCNSILKYGIACYKKRCQVTVVKEKVE